MKLDFEQRQKARKMLFWIVDDPEQAAFEIVGLQARIAELEAVIDLGIGFCVAFREDVPDWQRFPEVGILFSKLTAVKETRI